MKRGKTLSLLMALSLSAALVGCNNTTEPADNDQANEAEVVETETDENVEVEDTTEEETPEETIEPTEEETDAETGDADEGDQADTEGAVAEDGTYEGSAPGYGGDITVAVDLKDGKIDKIDIVDDKETEGVGKVALDVLKDRIVEGQSTDVEAVTGATASSRAIMLATSKALEEAGVADNFKEAYVTERDYPSNLEADVVVLGGGGAGLAAAVEAIDAGSSVIVLEKNGYVGGNTILCGGIYNAPDPDLQEPADIEDSEELFFTQTYEAGDEVANPDLVRILTGNAYDGLEWLKSIGMEFRDEIGQGAGSLHPRTHTAVKPNGTGFIDAYMENLEGNEDFNLLTETTAEHIIMEDGRASGVKAKNYDGSDLTIKANQAVIVSTGGFSKNSQMVMEYRNEEKWPNLDENTISTNLDALTGDGIIMAEEVGADLVDMDQMQFLYLGIPDRGPITGILDLAAEKVIFVNNEGNRFVREDGRRDVISKAVLDQPGGTYWMLHSSDVIDMSTAKTVEQEDFTEVVEEGKYGWVMADTLEELAEKMGVPYENLQKTVDEYNQDFHDQVEEDEYGRILFTYPMEKGPYAAVPRTAALHHTMGGLRIDTDTHVLDAEGNIIPGLYAAGEVTGGIHGANRVGGNAVVDTVVFGRIAGQNAAAEPKN